MASLDAFVELWSALSLNAATHPTPVGVDEYPVDEASPDRTPSSLDEARRQALGRRGDLVSRFVPEFIDTDDPYIAQTLPCWLSCLADPDIIRLSAEVPAPRLAVAAAEVLYARWLRSRDIKAVTNRLEDIVGRTGERTRLTLELRQTHANFLSLVSGATGGSAASSSASAAVRQTVIVHGTWAAGATWWRDPAGLGAPPTPDSLWNYLSVNGATNLVGYGHEFFWSGGNSDADRRQGAADFVNWWNGIGAPVLDVVAHSHGGNVVMGACLLEPSINIRRFVLLGTPARFDFVPRASQVERAHNVYSDSDLVQVPGSWGAQRGEGRTQSDHLQAQNWYVPYWDPNARVTAVGHSDLHHPDVWKNNGLLALLS